MNFDERSALERELVMDGLDGRLTEQRYNEILDLLLPAITVPEAQFTLESFGEQAWTLRREARERQTRAA